ncbi:MAG: hypothetical protein HN742_32555 [Lentisphaerae bacterium]|jgi:hypothetical protein|nr:hypothetical protein [Lentisphaerota bacterium]MBT4814085.1 hypothetical protein [Lentisphaerota bacterium]MBT5608990.1 hypothetical protein [Lentisphaerota bacterium]MBT7054667.1 hypothetical protein [Lentisphaerota bacterium]MBT7846647.1 hypothetical protein [Lentisphaerota bacterium]
MTRHLVCALTLLTGVTMADWQAVEQPDLTAQVKAAKPIETEDLCQPIMSTRRDAVLYCPNPDGKTWDVILHYAPQYGGPNSFRICDTGTGEVTEFETGRYYNVHIPKSAVAPDGKLYISILGKPHIKVEICVYDPATNTMQLNAFDMPDDMRGETHPFVLGWDGMLYAMGGHTDRSVTACQVNWKTGDVTLYGPMGPSHKPRGSWAYYGGVDDRYIYIASGKVPWYLVAYDRETRTSETLLETTPPGGVINVRQQRYGCTAAASKVVGTDGARTEYWLYEGKAIPKKSPKEAPPWPEPEDGGVAQVRMPPRPDVSLARAEPGPDGKAQCWIRTQAAKEAAKGLPEDATPEQQGWQVFRYSVPVFPQGLYRLREMPDGRLFGTGGAYLGHFLFDPKTGKYQHPGSLHLSHYATAFQGGKIYMSGYPTSPLYEWEPNLPWTANAPQSNGRALADTAPDSNPRCVVRLGGKELAGTHKMYAGTTGANGKVYFGGRWYRDGAGGGLAWHDPATGKAGGTWEPFSNYQITHMTPIQDGRRIAISTRSVADPLLNKPTPEQGRLFLFDTETNEMTGHVDPVLKAKGAGPVAGVGRSRIIGWTVDPSNDKSSILYGCDAATGSVAWQKPLPFPLPVKIGSNQKECFDFRLGPDGKVWTYLPGNVLVTIDPVDGRITPLGRVRSGGRIAFSGGHVYVGGTASVRRLKGITVP